MVARRAKHGQKYGTAGFVSGSTSGTTLTAHGSSHTKGSWTALDTSTDVDAEAILVHIDNNTTAAGITFMVDLSIGAGTSVLVENMQAHFRFTEGDGPSYLIPIAIPAGTNLQARCQSSSGSAPIDVRVLLIPKWTGETLQKCVAYGADTSLSRGQQVDPGGVANTKGSWVQLDGSTSDPIKWLTLSFGNNANCCAADYGFSVDVGVGAAASEQVIVGDIPLSTGVSRDNFLPLTITIPVEVPSGSRLAVRTACSGTDATDRLCYIMAHGVA